MLSHKFRSVNRNKTMMASNSESIRLFVSLLSSFDITTVAWVMAAILVARQTSFFSVLRNSSQANRTLLRIASLGATIVFTGILYLIVYLPKVKGLADSSAWSIYCPRVVPTMIAVTVTSCLIFRRATWPVWGFFTPLISGTQFMGILMVLHFIPSMGLF